MRPTRPRLLALFTSAAVVAALLVLPAAAGAAGGGDSASGNGTQGSTTTAFSARSTNVNTDARGRIRVTFTNSDPNDVYTAEVTCMRVVGATVADPYNTVVVSGRIVDQPPGSSILSLQVHARDSGKFSATPDAMITLFSGTPSPPDSSCPVPFAFLSPLADGEVTISNTLP